MPICGDCSDRRLPCVNLGVSLNAERRTDEIDRRHVLKHLCPHSLYVGLHFPKNAAAALFPCRLKPASIQHQPAFPDTTEGADASADTFPQPTPGIESSRLLQPTEPPKYPNSV